MVQQYSIADTSAMTDMSPRIKSCFSYNWM